MENTSIGIIGGADGPTAVLVSSTPMLPIVLVAAGVIAIVIIAIAVFNAKK